MNQVQAWIDNGCNYREGVALYEKLSKSKNLLHFFNGDEKFKDRPTKLKYELMKLQPVSVSKKSKPKQVVVQPPSKPNIQPPSKPVVHQPKPNLKAVETVVNQVKNNGAYPQVVQDAINLYSSLYKRKSILWEKRAKMGFDNTPALVSARKLMNDEIIDLSNQMEVLFEVKKQYEEKGIVPTENVALQLMAHNEEELPNSVTELRKLKKNLQTNNSKDRNLLDYQSKASKQWKTPMPAGDKRFKIEERIKARDKQIEVIDDKLKQLNAN